MIWADNTDKDAKKHYGCLQKAPAKHHYTKMAQSCIALGDIASDLYGPQFWDDNFQFSFSVVVSCKSNKQLGYF